MSIKTATREPITAETLRSLAELEGAPVVSVFLPTVRATFHKQENRDRLKTLLARSEPLLSARGMKRKEIDRILDPARELIDDQEFWSHRLDGLALYAARNFLLLYTTPFPVSELVEVSSAPCIRPLLPALVSEGHFYVLAISRNLTRLLRGTRGEMHEINLSSLGVSLSLREALRFDDLDRQMQSHATGRAEPRLQTHSQSTARAGRHVWHGHGGGEEEVKEQVGRFFQAVDKALCKMLATERAPLVLAAVAYEQDMYRLHSKYAAIAPEGVNGNPDRLSPKDLHEAAWPIARRALEARRDAATIAYREAPNVGEASDDLGEILRAVYEGRVSVFLVRSGAEAWGVFDSTTFQIEAHTSRQALDVDLLDLCVRQTLLRGGDAYPIDSEQMPGKGAGAAVYRFGGDTRRGPPVQLR